jgi:hypothetical protein
MMAPNGSGARIPGPPVVIYFTGIGVPAVADLKLQALVSDFIRLYFYDRAGCDRSECSPIRHSIVTNSLRTVNTTFLSGGHNTFLGRFSGCLDSSILTELCPQHAIPEISCGTCISSHDYAEVTTQSLPHICTFFPLANCSTQLSHHIVSNSRIASVVSRGLSNVQKWPPGIYLTATPFAFSKYSLAFS